MKSANNFEMEELAKAEAQGSKEAPGSKLAGWPELARAASVNVNGGLPKLIPTTNIYPGKFTCRVGLNAESKSYKQFKKTVVGAGNFAPILVRPSGPDTFEIVYGHLRHKACLEAGRDVWAVVAELDDREASILALGENSFRRDQCPFDKGALFKRITEDGTWPSSRHLADAVGLNHSTISKLIKLASLPEAIVAAFGNREHLLVNWGAKLEAAVNHPDRGAAVLALAGEIAIREKLPEPKDIFNELVAVGADLPVAGKKATSDFGFCFEDMFGKADEDKVEVEVGDKLRAVITVPSDPSKLGFVVTFEPGLIRLEDLKAALLPLWQGELNDELTARLAGVDISVSGEAERGTF